MWASGVRGGCGGLGDSVHFPHKLFGGRLGVRVIGESLHPPFARHAAGGRTLV